MSSPFKLIDGSLPWTDRKEWLLPSADQHTIDWPFTHGPTDVDGALVKFAPYMQFTRRAIQAGGNIGIWPIRLAQIYDHVETFEPEAVNYECLLHNTLGIRNIQRHNKALGSTHKNVHMTLEERYIGHCGAFHVADGGDVQMITIDSLDFNDVDLIYLDVEGYEYPALLGAINTIKNCRPLIGIESKGLERRFKHDQSPEAFLKQLNYINIGRPNNSDYLFVPDEITTP